MDELRRLVQIAQSLLRDGYYNVGASTARAPSFLETLGTPNQPSDVIAEIKFASPTMPAGLPGERFPQILKAYADAQPLGLSILAEPNVFRGSLDFVRQAAATGLPVLFKDVVVDPRQVEAAAACGASAVLVIQTLTTRGLPVTAPQGLIDAAHDLDLDVVLEVHTLDDLNEALRTDADVLGINSRDLATMEVDAGTAATLLGARRKDRPVIAMSGVERRAQIDTLLRAGADAVLVGTSVMSDPDPRQKLEELLHG
jgi:indole-3-glycerol phosphate synthase